MDDPSQPPPLPTQSPPPRHGCLTTWLILMLVANAATAIVTPFSVAGMRNAGLQPSPIGIGVIVICAIANIAFAIALFRWQKWGFYGFAVTTAIALITNLSLGVGIGRTVLGLIGIVLLYWVLNMGGTNKAWPYLK